jgi:hypothetical protein
MVAAGHVKIEDDAGGLVGQVGRYVGQRPAFRRDPGQAADPWTSGEVFAASSARVS